MTQLEANEKDARRYRIVRELMCASEATQDGAGALIQHILGEGDLTPQLIDRAIDHLLNTLKLV